MSFRIKRSSSFSSSSLGRRSSINPKDVERIQQLLQRQKKISPQVCFCIVIFCPIAVFVLSSIARLYFGSYWAFTEADYELEFPNLTVIQPWNCFLVVLLIQLIFLLILPSDDFKVRNEHGEKVIINANSFISCLLISLLYILGSTLGFFKGTIIFENFIGISFIFSLFIIVLILHIHFFGNEEDSSKFICFLEFNFFN